MFRQRQERRMTAAKKMIPPTNDALGEMRVIGSPFL